ncbi:lytic transglycosylase domain-containing protein [Pectobacterium polaris]|uniref:lytic transglycosylase domain-containing protein n=1 Tax=Pectobacterium polaris TaxID=2042057 RepID=UPI00202D8F32|nr:lytic transglycosylase domain-containing protein [Pectobacterium polaris]MCL6324998.1 lytic transglycosylase domain-containing protein [Pectobacterium polaris]
MAETIDSLLVSLGLDVDQKSFKKANDALKGVKDTALLLFSAAGGITGLNAMTAGFSRMVTDLEAFSKHANIARNDVLRLSYAMEQAGGKRTSANSLIDKANSWALTATYGTFSDKAFMNNAGVNPHDLQGKDSVEVIKTMADYYNQAAASGFDGLQNFREGMNINEDDEKLFRMGRAGIDRYFAEFNKRSTGVSDDDVKIGTEYRTAVTDLATNMMDLNNSIGALLTPEITKLIQKTDEWLLANKTDIVSSIRESLPYIKGIAAGVAVLAAAKTTKALGIPGLHKLGLPVAAAVTAEPFIDGALNSIFGESEYFQNIRTAPSWGDFGQALIGNGKGRYENGRWISPNDSPATSPTMPRSGEHSLFSSLEGKYGLPPGVLNGLYQTESSGGKNLVSPKGALGPFQFMPGTAKDMGLYGSDVFNLEKSADAAARYMRQLMDRHNGNLPKALASYNWGMGNVDEYGMNAIPAETRKYIGKVTGHMPTSPTFNELMAPYNTPPSYPRSRSNYNDDDGEYGSGSRSSRPVTFSNQITISGVAGVEETERAVRRVMDEQSREYVELTKDDGR